MNKIIITGRMTKDPEVKMTQNQIEVCSFTVAVDRIFKKADGTRECDFISCVAWRQQAKLLGQYFSKGSRIGIIGSIQTRDYKDKDDKKVYVTEVVVDEIEFIDSKKDSEHADTEPKETEKSFYEEMADDSISLPFDL